MTSNDAVVQYLKKEGVPMPTKKYPEADYNDSGSYRLQVRMTPEQLRRLDAIGEQLKITERATIVKQMMDIIEEVLQNEDCKKVD